MDYLNGRKRFLPSVNRNCKFALKKQVVKNLMQHFEIYLMQESFVNLLLSSIKCFYKPYIFIFVEILREKCFSVLCPVSQVVHKKTYV